VRLKKSVLFVYVDFISFVKMDYKILSEKYQVTKYKYKLSKNLFIFLFEFIKMSLYLIKNIYKFDLLYCWFAGYHTLLPTFFFRIFRKESIVIIGGYDAAKVPELNYGAHTKKIYGWFVKRTADFATNLLTVSKFTQTEFFKYVNCKNKIKTKMIYNGVDINIFRRNYNVKKEKNIITVCGASDIRTVLRKGVDFFVQVAFELPHYKFKIYGLEEEAYRYISKEKPKNLEIFHRISHSKLINEFSKAKVACQFSRYEAFGVAILEAMCCECIPIGYDYGGTSEVINNSGYLIPELNSKHAAKCIEKAINSNNSIGKKVRQESIKNFSFEKREKEIMLLLKNLLN
jgi:glycosyltransferase involved in cell wall biosynthesis